MEYLDILITENKFKFQLQFKGTRQCIISK